MCQIRSSHSGAPSRTAAAANPGPHGRDPVQLKTHICSCSVSTMFMTARVRRSRARSEHLVLLHLPALSAANTRPTKQSAAPAKRGRCHFSTLSKPSATKGPQQCEAAHRAIPTSTAGHAERDEAGYPALSAPRNLICCFFTLRAAYFLKTSVQK